MPFLTIKIGYMANDTPSLKPLFDTLEHLHDGPASSIEHQHAIAFLKSYRGSEGTFNSYRREVERLLQWSLLIAKKPVKDLRREDIESFIHFCQNPPIHWIGTKKAPRFIEKDGRRIPNPEWRPFVATVKKSAFRQGQRPDKKKFELSQGAVKETFAILSTFFNYLLQEEHMSANPVALIRQKSKFIRKHQQSPRIRRLTDLQWNYLLDTAKKMAEENAELHQKTLLMVTALYAMYLRISELAASKRWVPKMCDFHRDSDGNWWFTTVGKGNKERQIAVSDAMLNALKTYRKHLNLSSLPSPADTSPLFPKTKGKGPITSTTYIRRMLQKCFDKAIESLRDDNFHEEAESFTEATVHWLRHTGISDDVKIRPREHVRDDAGHSTSAITDKYIDINLRERHASAKKKIIATP